jgi:uncharacterized protein with HEPN domain
MSKRSSQLLIKDIKTAIQKIKKYTHDMHYEDFFQDEKTIDAVIRNFEIIGEAANRIPEDFKKGHPDIDWFRIRGFRNRIVHDYFGVDLEVVWTIIEEYLDDLDTKIAEF